MALAHTSRHTANHAHSLDHALAIFQPGFGQVHRFALLPQEGGDLPAQPAGLPAEEKVYLKAAGTSGDVRIAAIVLVDAMLV